MDQQSRWILIGIMAVMAVGGLTVVLQAHGTQGWATGIAIFVIAVVIGFVNIQRAMGGSSGGGYRGR